MWELMLSYFLMKSLAKITIETKLHGVIQRQAIQEKISLKSMTQYTDIANLRSISSIKMLSEYLMQKEAWTEPTEML